MTPGEFSYTAPEMSSITSIKAPNTHKLLLLCSNPFCLNEKIIPLLSKSIDWIEFADLAHQHRLLPLLHRLAAEWPRSCIQPHLLEKVERAYTANCVRVEFLSSQLMRITSLFEEHNIRAVPWKGPPLAFKVYPDPYMRPMDDLDFIIHHNDIIKAVNVLSEAGFQPRHRMNRGALTRYLKAGYEYICSSPAGDLCLELSTRPLPPLFAVNGCTDSIWSADKPYLSDELYFHFLCLHGAHHCWDRLIWISDLCAFLHTHPGLDLSEVEKLAMESHTEKMVTAAMALVAATGFELKRNPFNINSINIDQLISLIIAPASSRFSELARITQFYSRKSDRLLHMFKWIAAPTYSDWNLVDLPKGLSIFYWLIRPIRIITSAEIRRLQPPKQLAAPDEPSI